mmetsp:Transcript_8054/g.17784  ORF Transcript_8054/g.17784 Transcript_8054/m.17784 type:complete len:101 (+) Transcript_8054:611-913(+)
MLTPTRAPPPQNRPRTDLDLRVLIRAASFSALPASLCELGMLFRSLLDIDFSGQLPLDCMPRRFIASTLSVDMRLGVRRENGSHDERRPVPIVRLNISPV